MEELSEEERKALRGSKFAPLPPPRHQPRVAHPGGPMKTNKAAALAKFLQRKSQENNGLGLASVDPRLIQLAVKNAKHTVESSGTSSSGRIVHHVDSFGDPEYISDGEEVKIPVSKKQSKKQKKKKRKVKKEKESKKQKVVS